MASTHLKTSRMSCHSQQSRSQYTRSDISSPIRTMSSSLKFAKSIMEAQVNCSPPCSLTYSRHWTIDTTQGLQSASSKAPQSTSTSQVSPSGQLSKPTRRTKSSSSPAPSPRHDPVLRDAPQRTQHSRFISSSPIQTTSSSPKRRNGVR